MAIASTEIFNQHQQTSGTIVQVQQISTSSQQNVTGAIRSSTTSKIHLNMNTSINVQDYSINMNPPNININTNGNDNHNHNPPPKILENIETSSDCFEEKTSTEASPGSSQVRIHIFMCPYTDLDMPMYIHVYPCSCLFILHH
jgi:hypothetical protein